MTNQHQINPPPELVRQWMERTSYDDHTWFYESYIAEQAARWGADQELEACCEWLQQNCGRWEIPMSLRAARRPKLGNLRRRASIHFESHAATFETAGGDSDLIRRALEALSDD